MKAVLYHSQYGTSKGVAETLAERLGEGTLIYNLDTENPNLKEITTLVLVCPIYFGAVNKRVSQFIMRNDKLLRERRFWVCLCNAISPVPEVVLQSLHPEIETMAQEVIPLGTRIRYEELSWTHRLIYRLQSKSTEDLNTLDLSKLDAVVAACRAS